MEAQTTGDSILTKLLQLRRSKEQKEQKEFKDMLESLPEGEETLLWDHVFELLQDHIIKELAKEEMSNSDACELIGLVTDSCDAKSPTNPSLLTAAEYLHSVLSVLGEGKLKNLILDLFTKWCISKLNHWENIWINTFVWTLKASLKDGVPRKVARAASLFRDDTHNLDVMPPEELACLLELFGKCATSQHYLSNNKGKQFITCLLKSKTVIIRAVYKAIDKAFPYFTKSQVETLGSCFLSAWKSKTDASTEALEESIQDIMLTAINLDPGLPKNYHEHLYRFLNVFHAQHSNMEISKMLFRLYQPILWRGLKAPNPMVRQSAAHVFFGAFPLVENYDVAAREIEIREHCALIRFLLLDPYPGVRVETIKGTMKAFSCFYGLFPYDEKKKIMNILLKKNGQDCSSPESRRSVVNGLTAMTKNMLTHSQLKALMPFTKHYIDDPVGGVRAAYFSLLYAARKVAGFKFVDVVSIEELLDLLPQANHEESRLIVRVLHNTFFNPSVSIKERMERRLSLADKNPRIADKLYYEIARTSQAENVLEFLLTTCIALQRNFQDKREDIPVVDSDEEDDLDVSVEEIESDKLSEEQVVVFVDTLAVMFTSLRTRVKELQNESLKAKWKLFHVKMKKMLRSLLKAVMTVQLRLSCFYLASLMPDASEVVPTIGRQCMSMLQQMMTQPGDTDPVIREASIRACLYTVCRARKAADVLSAISDSLEQLLVQQTSRRRVRFQVKSHGPQAELDILKGLLSMRETVAILLKSHLVPLFDIWNVLLRVVMNFREGLSQPESVCNEELLTLVFGLYLRLSILLSNKENPANKQKFDTAAALNCHMSWVKEHLLPSIAVLTEPRREACIKYVQVYLESSEDVFRLDMATQEFADNMLDFMKMCKDSGLSQLNGNVAAVAKTMDGAKLLFLSDKEKEASLTAALANLSLEDVQRREPEDGEKENQEPSRRTNRKRSRTLKK
ncbi:condensin-2 complex subunit G2-like isoform X2 [Ornithodoros turicata]|uniref:condensin-2 complex subunit G2-like isoform X2 n=1 Tax=Ornithodoros turicata TaxID=34597 RepID=UPI0031393628